MKTMKTTEAKRLIASFLLMTFTFSNTVWAVPNNAMLQVAAPGAAVDGVRVPFFANNVLIPESFGTVEARHQAAKSEGFSIIHLQDAHTSLEAQQSIAKILDYLVRDYGVDMIFVEGAVEKLESKNLQFLENEKANEDLVELLAKEGVVSGAELYLLKNKTQPVEELGVENLELYRSNLKSFREVYAYKNDSEAYLENVKVRIATLASHVFNKTLKEFFHEWVFYQDNQDLLMRHLETLAVSAKKQLQIDLNDARQQLDWPALVRYNKLREAEGALQPEKAQEELKNLVQWLAENNSGAAYREALSHYNAQKGFELKAMTAEAQALLQKGSRYFLEGFYDQTRDKGFDFRAYPELSKAWGISILREELDAGRIYEEIQKLTERLLEKMAPSANEKELLSIYQDYLSLGKVLKLEMTYREEAALQTKKTLVRPDSLEFRIAALQQEKRPAQLKGQMRSLNQADQAFDRAVAFYQQARGRDTVIFDNMMKQMKAAGKHQAVLITGGFHTQGIAEQMKKQNISYVEVTPHISEIGDPKAYVAAMTLKGIKNPKESAVPFVRLADGGMTAWTTRGFEGEARYFGGRLVSAMRTLAFGAVILAGFNREVAGQTPELRDYLSSAAIAEASGEKNSIAFSKRVVTAGSEETTQRRPAVDLINERRRKPGLAPQKGTDREIPTLPLRPDFKFIALKEIIQTMTRLRETFFAREERVAMIRRSEVRTNTDGKKLPEEVSRQEQKLISNWFMKNPGMRLVRWLLTPLSLGFGMIASLAQGSPKPRAGYTRYPSGVSRHIEILGERIVFDTTLGHLAIDTVQAGPAVAGGTLAAENETSPSYALSDPRSGASNGITGGYQAHGVYIYNSPAISNVSAPATPAAEGEAAGAELKYYYADIFSGGGSQPFEIRVYEGAPNTSRVIFSMPVSAAASQETVVSAVRAGGIDYVILDHGNHSHQVDVIADFTGTPLTHHFNGDAHVTGVRALVNGDLEVRTTSADQKDNVVHVLRGSQMISTVHTPFVNVSTQTQGTLTPLLLQQIPSRWTQPAQLQTNLVGPQNDILSGGTKYLSVTAERVRVLAAEKDQGVQMIMGAGMNSGSVPAIPRLLNQLNTLTLSLEAIRQSQAPGQAIDAPIPVRVELVGRQEYPITGYSYPLSRETADSVIVMVRPGQAYAQIPLSAFTHYDFSLPVHFISIINADSMPVEMNTTIANYPIPQIQIQSTVMHPEPGAPIQISGTVQSFDGARQKLQIFEGNNLLAADVPVSGGLFSKDLNLAAGGHDIRIKITDTVTGWEVGSFKTIISVLPIAGVLQPLDAGTALNGLSGSRSIFYSFNLVTPARPGEADSFVTEFGGGITPKVPFLASDFGGQIVVGLDQIANPGVTAPTSIRVHVQGVSQSGGYLPDQDYVIKTFDSTPGIQVYAIPFGSFPKVTQITLLPDFGQNNAASPHLTVRLSNTAVQEFRAVSTDKTVADISLPKDSAGKAPAINIIASAGVTQQTELTATGVHTSFTATRYGDYLVQQYRYDAVSDWSGVESIRVGALKTLQRNDTTPNDVRLEVKDSNGKTATISYQNFALGHEQILSLPVNTIAAVAARQGQAGFDIHKIASVAAIYALKGNETGTADFDIDPVQAGAVITPSLDFYSSDINAASFTSLLGVNLIGDAQIGFNGHDAVTITKNGGLTYTTPLTRAQLTADGTGSYIFSLDATAPGAALITLTSASQNGQAPVVQTFVLRGLDSIVGGGQLFALPISAALPNLAHVEIRALNAPKAGEQPAVYTMTLRSADLEFSTPDKHLFYAENIAVPSVNTSSFQTVAPAATSYQGYVTPLGSRGEILDTAKNIPWFVHGINYDNTSTTQPGIQTADWSQAGQVRFYLKTAETSAKIEIKDSLGGKAVIQFKNLIPGAWQPVELDTAALREISIIQGTPLTLNKIHTAFVVIENLPAGKPHFIELATRPSTNPQDTTLINAVSPLGALAVINQLNNPEAFAALTPSARLVYDANRDGTVSPMDALVIINELNRRAGKLTAEGEPAFENLSGINDAAVVYRRDGNSTVISTAHLTHTVTPRGAGEAPEIRTALTLPQGWTRAVSNSRFAFREYSHNGVITLQLLNLTNNAVQNLAEQKTSAVTGQASTFFSHKYDVSPNNYPGGPVVVYQDGSSSYRGTGTYTKVQRIGSGQVLTARAYFISNPVLESIGFGANGRITLTLSNALYHVESRQTVTVAAGGITQANIPETQIPLQLINQNGAVHVGAGAKVAAVKLPRVGNGDSYEIAVFDTSRGIQDMRYLRKVPITQDTSAVFSYVNSYVSSTGRRIIAVGLDADHANHTLFVDAVTGQTLKLPVDAAHLDKTAAIISQQSRQGDIVTFNARNQDGTARTLSVDLKTLTFVPAVPQGWTRAVSNPSFAFREYSDKGVITLQLLNLTNNAVQNLAKQKTSTVTGQASTFFSHQYDVSPSNYPGGPVVVYQTGSSSYRATVTDTKVQRVGSNQVLTARAYFITNPVLESVAFGINGRVTLTLSNALYHVQTQQTISVGTHSITQPNIPQTQIPLQLINPNSEVHVGTRAKVAAVKLPRVGNGDSYEIAVFDTSRGIQDMRYIRKVRITQDTGAVFSYVNSYVSSTGRRIIAVGLDADHANHTLFVDAVTGQTLKLPVDAAHLGKTAAIISQQSRQGDIVTFNARNQDGTARTLSVDLKTLTFPLKNKRPNLDAFFAQNADLFDDNSLDTPAGRSEVRQINATLLQAYGRSLPAVVFTARAAYATVSEQLPNDLISKLVDLVAPKISEETQISQTEIRSALTRRMAELQGLMASHRLTLDAEGSVILSADHLDKRKNVLLAMIPFMVGLASAERRQSFFFSGGEARDLKQLVLNPQHSGLTSLEMSRVSKIFSFAAPYDPEKDLREHIRQERTRGVPLTASVSPEVSKTYAAALESILRNIEAPAEFSNLKTAEQVAAAAEAFAVRAYMLLSLAKYLKAELTKKQAEPAKDLIARFFNNLGITVENVKSDGSFALSLRSVSQYLSALKEAQTALGKSA